MPYIVPSRDKISNADFRMHQGRIWDGLSPITSDSFAFYATPDYTVPTSYTVKMKSAGIVAEEQILAAHANFVKINTALIEIGLIGGKATDGDTIRFYQQQTPLGRVMDLRSLSYSNSLAKFHLLQGNIESYSKYLGRQPKLENNPTNEEFTASVTELFEQTKSTLIHHCVEPTPRNIRKLFLFQAINKLNHRVSWTTLAPRFTESIMSFLRADASLETICYFHRSGNIPDPNQKGQNQSLQMMKFTPSSFGFSFNEADIQTIASLPATLIRELYLEGGLLYCGSEEEHREKLKIKASLSENPIPWNQ